MPPDRPPCRRRGSGDGADRRTVQKTDGRPAVRFRDSGYAGHALYYRGVMTMANAYTMLHTLSDLPGKVVGQQDDLCTWVSDGSGAVVYGLTVVLMGLGCLILARAFGAAGESVQAKGRDREG